MSEIPSTKHCYKYMNPTGSVKTPPEDCPGVLTSTFKEGYPEDGYYIEVCPNPKTLGAFVTCVNFCGNGPDVIVMNQDTIPTPEEYQAVVTLVETEWLM